MLIRIYVEVFRGTPMVLQAVFVYYGLPYFTDNAVEVHEHVDGGHPHRLDQHRRVYGRSPCAAASSPSTPGQTEGAKAIGMTHVQTMTSVIMPQALRNIMPQIGNNYIINVKDTSVMFIISFTEFFAAHRYIVGVNNMYFPSAAIEMVGYLTMTLLASLLLRWVEKRMDGSDSYDLVQTDALTMSAGTYNHPSKGTPFDERSKEYRGDAGGERRNRSENAREGGYDGKHSGNSPSRQILRHARGAARHRFPT